MSECTCSLMTGKMAGVCILLMSNGCVLGITSHLPFPLRASCAGVMPDSLFTRQEPNLNVSPETKRPHSDTRNDCPFT